MPAMQQSGEQLDLLQGQGAGYLPGPLQGLQIFCRDYAVVLLVWHKARSAEGKAEGAEQALPDTRGGRAVEKFRQNMRAIEKRLIHKE